MKTNGEIMFEKTDNFHKFCTITIFIRLLYLVTFIADVGLLTIIDYYSWLLFHGRIRDRTEIQHFNLFKWDNLLRQITIRSCQQQTKGLIIEFTQLRIRFIFQVEFTC